MAVLFAAAVFLALTGIVAPAEQRTLLFVVTIELILLICAVVFSKLTIKIDGETLRLPSQWNYLQESPAGRDNSV